MNEFLLQIFGYIESGWTASGVQEKLISAGGKDLLVQMNSIGGDVAETTTIYNMIKEYKEEHSANVTFDILGYAQSCASYITLVPGAKRMSLPSGLKENTMAFSPPQPSGIRQRNTCMMRVPWRLNLECHK